MCERISEIEVQGSVDRTQPYRAFKASDGVLFVTRVCIQRTDGLKCDRTVRVEFDRLVHNGNAAGHVSTRQRYQIARPVKNLRISAIQLHRGPGQLGYLAGCVVCPVLRDHVELTECQIDQCECIAGIDLDRSS